MVIIAWSAIAAFYQEYPDAKNSKNGSKDSKFR